MSVARHYGGAVGLLSVSEFKFTVCVRIYIQCLCQNLHHPSILNPSHFGRPLESLASSTSLWCPGMYLGTPLGYGGVFGGVPPRYARFAPPLKS